MKLKFDVKVGDRTIQIEDECANAAEAWKILAFWDSLPTAGPGGEEDLRFSYRTPKGYEYFAIECPAAGKEFKFGQMKKDSSKLFPKHWDEIRHGQDHYEEEEEESEPAPAPKSQQPRQSAATITDIDSGKFFAFQREHRIDFKQADQIRLECTSGKQTDWSKAFAKLKALAESERPSGTLTANQLALQGTIAGLEHLNVSHEQVEKRIAGTCDGISRIEDLSPSQTAKALAMLQRDLEAKQAAMDRQKKGAA